MKTLATIIALSIFTLSVTACSHNHTYSSGLFGGKTIKASKNYVTKNIKVDNFTGLNLAGSPDVTYTQKAGKPTVEVYTSDNIVDLIINWKSVSLPKHLIISPLQGREM